MEAIKLFSYRSTYNPIRTPGDTITTPSFPSLAEFLVSAETLVQSLTMAGYQQLITTYDISNDLIPPEWPPAIQCTDNGGVVYGRSLASLLPSILLYEAQSFILGEDSVTTQIRCAGWSIVGKGVYSGKSSPKLIQVSPLILVGPFGGPTANPILFISNTRDPVLPLQYGQKGAALYQGAQLLTVDGTGVCLPLFHLCYASRAFKTLRDRFYDRSFS